MVEKKLSRRLRIPHQEMHCLDLVNQVLRFLSKFWSKQGGGCLFEFFVVLYQGRRVLFKPAIILVLLLCDIWLLGSFMAAVVALAACLWLTVSSFSLASTIEVSGAKAWPSRTDGSLWIWQSKAFACGDTSDLMNPGVLVASTLGVPSLETFLFLCPHHLARCGFHW